MDPIFPIGESTNPLRGGTNVKHNDIFGKKCVQIREFCPIGGVSIFNCHHFQTVCLGVWKWVLCGQTPSNTITKVLLIHLVPNVYYSAQHCTALSWLKFVLVQACVCLLHWQKYNILWCQKTRFMNSDLPEWSPRQLCFCWYQTFVTDTWFSCYFDYFCMGRKWTRHSRWLNCMVSHVLYFCWFYSTWRCACFKLKLFHPVLHEI